MERTIYWNLVLGRRHGEQSLLDIEPDELHGRVPAYVGNPELIHQLEPILG